MDRNASAIGLYLMMAVALREGCVDRNGHKDDDVTKNIVALREGCVDRNF